MLSNIERGECKEWIPKPAQLLKANDDELSIYQSQDGIVLNVQLSNETVWLSQDQLTVLFERDQSVISRHLSNVFKEGELTKESNMQKVHIANSDKPVTLYSLDVIISVGYRVKSIRGTQFRQWATKRLKDFLIEGVAIICQKTIDSRTVA